MKAKILLVIVIGIVYCQIDPGTAINSCGKIGYVPPSTSEDCKPGGEHNLCCYIDIPSRSLKYCAYMPNTKLEDDVITEFKEIIGINNVNIICNSSTKLALKLISSLLMLFFILFL